MKIALIAFTAGGCTTCERMMEALKKLGYECEGYKKGTFKGGENLKTVASDLGSWTEEQFGSCDGLIFIGATGIAVRAIAPFVKSKTTDPACITVDEKGRYVIPLLSGHIGGANVLAEALAEETGAVPVITTATDINSLLAVDSWAKKNELYITDMKLAKKVSAELLEGKKIGVMSDFKIKGKLPAGFEYGEGDKTALDITYMEKEGKRNLCLIPRSIVLGIGCRKGIDCTHIEEFVEDTLREFNISKQALAEVVSIDLKEHEKGLLEFCEKKQLPFRVFSARQLSEVKGDFEPSAFVSSVTGVDNVCERSAVLGADGGQVIIKKRSRQGVTVSAAVKNLSFSFE